MAKERNIITDKLVAEKTGKSMEHWFLFLDKKGAREMSHVQIFELVSKTAGLKALGMWNQNLLATTYEWNRGIKARGQKGNGFGIAVSKTIDVPVAVLFRSWIDEKIRKKWLKEKITVRKSTENKSARVTWSDNLTSLGVDFYQKGKDKSQVVVQHLKIAKSKDADSLKDFWGKKLNELKTLLES